MNQQKFDQTNLKKQQPPSERNVGEAVSRIISGSIDCTNVSPMVRQLKKTYGWPGDLFRDLFIGITMGIVNVPQGMAHAIVAHLDMVYGLYSNIFPPLIYAFFGDSFKIPIGTTIYGNLIIAKFIDAYSSDWIDNKALVYDEAYKGIEIATTIALLSGLLMIGFSFLQLGYLSILMSDSMLRGFLCGISLLILLEYLPYTFDLTVTSTGQPFDIIYKIISFIQQLPNANRITALISGATILLFLFCIFVINPFTQRFTSMIFPMEFLALLFGTTCSWYFEVNQNYKVKIVGHVPHTLPYIHVPAALHLAPKLFRVSVMVGVIMYLTHLTLAKTIEARSSNRIRDNRELFVLGVINALCSLAECIPVGNSPCRTLLQENLGAVSQITSIVSAFFVLAGLLWLGPVLYFLPMCILAVIIIFSISHALLEIAEVVALWKVSKPESMVWMMTFLSVVFWSMEMGIIIGVSLSFLIILNQLSRPKTSLLGYVINPGVFVDTEVYNVDPPEISAFVYRFEAPICFFSARYYKAQLYRQIGFDPRHLPVKIVQSRIEVQRFCSTFTAKKRYYCMEKHRGRVVMNDIVLDFSTVSFIDWTGVKMVGKIIFECLDVDIIVCLANCTRSVYQFLRQDQKLREIIDDITFPNIQQAFRYIRASRIAEGKKYH